MTTTHSVRFDSPSVLPPPVGYSQLAAVRGGQVVFLAGQVSDSRPDRECANCGALRTGPFCAQCGQPLVTARLSLRGLASDLAHAFDFERGIVGTTVELFRRPHAIIAGYLRGRTVPYTNPVKHFVLVLSVTQVVALASGATGDFASGLTEAGGEGAVRQAVVLLDQFFVVLVAPAVLVLVAVQRRLFRQARWTYAEHLVSALFIGGNQLLLWIPAFVVVGTARPSLAVEGLVGLTLLASIAYYGWAARGLFGGSVWGTLGRALAVMALSAFVSFALLVLTLVALGIR